MIYLDKSIWIKGVEIRHTEFGLQHMIDHYETILRISTKEQVSDDVRKHIEALIVNYRLQQKLYERTTDTPADNNS